MAKQRKRIGEILLEKEMVTPEELELAIREQKRTKEILGRILVKKGFVREDEFLAAMSEQFGIPSGCIAHRYVDWDFVKGFSASLIIDHRCFPLSRDDEGLTVAISDPLNVMAVKKAESESGGRKVRLILVTETDMDDIIGRYLQFRRSEIGKMFK